MSMARIHSLGLFLACSSRIAFMSVCSLFLSLELLFSLTYFLAPFPFCLMSCFPFSHRERYVQMLDQIARQMIDFYKDMVTQRVMDQRILEELYNFKNVIEELTR